MWSLDSRQLSLPTFLTRPFRSLTLHLPPLNFITLHYAYFIGVCLLSSVIFWGSSTPKRSVSYCDSLFLVVSAMTEAGLNTINLSQLNTFQQFILFLLIMLGSAIWVSIAVLHIRRKTFENRFESIVEAGRQRRRERSNSRLSRRDSKSTFVSRADKDGDDDIDGRGRAVKSEKHPLAEESQKPAQDMESQDPSQPPDTENQVTFDDSNDKRARPKTSLTIDTGLARRITFASPASPTRARQHGRILSMQGVGARHNIYNHPKQTPRPIYSSEAKDRTGGTTHSGPPPGVAIGRNSTFAGLTMAERDRLGGAEYQAVVILSMIVPLYFVLWQLLGCIGLGAYVASKRADAAKVNAENPWYCASSCLKNSDGDTDLATGG